MFNFLCTNLFTMQPTLQRTMYMSSRISAAYEEYIHLHDVRQVYLTQIVAVTYLFTCVAMPTTLYCTYPSQYSYGL